jgi:serine protease Do
LLRVKPKKPLTPVSFGDSSVMRVGDWVMAIGNPFGLGGTVTVGIISAKKRDINAGPYDEFLQTDAAINRGNSGGPLFNMAGEVIGINTAIISPTGGSIGIGFAHPANAARHVIEQLRKYGEARRGWLGVRIQTVTEAIAESRGMDEPGGALVAKVLEDSPAAMAGIELGDVIVRFDGKEIDSMRALPRVVAQTEIGRTVEIEVMRDNERKTFQVAVGRLSEETVASRTPEAEPEEEQDEEATALLGLSIAPLSDELRSRYGIDSKVKGVVVVEVDPNSAAARNDIRPGNVIMEVTNTKVSKPADVSARVDEVRRMGRLNVQLLINDGEDNLRFVAVPIDED